MVMMTTKQTRKTREPADLIVSDLWERLAGGEDVTPDFLELARCTLRDVADAPRLLLHRGHARLMMVVGLIRFAQHHYVVGRLANGEDVYAPAVREAVKCLWMACRYGWGQAETPDRFQHAVRALEKTRATKTGGGATTRTTSRATTERQEVPS